jgi:hypothetical protein
MGVIIQSRETRHCCWLTAHSGTNLSSVEIRVPNGSTEDNLVLEVLHTDFPEKGIYKWCPIKSITISLDDYAEPDCAYGMDKQLLKILRFPQLE